MELLLWMRVIFGIIMLMQMVMENLKQLKNLPRDIAMCVGTGIRWDLSYLVIRLDAGYKVKDPVREGDGWT